jgi:branched-subunit amino acid aminotransferase/4-amino-4-deoxychorismate lyase
MISTMEQFIHHNGLISATSSPVISVANRSFRYGDGLFESIRIANHRPQFLKEHLKRLHTGMQVLKMQPHSSLNESFLENAIIELAGKNNIGGGGRVRLTVYRNDGGLYTPDTNEVSYLIEIDPLTNVDYELNSKGYTIDLYSELKKQQQILSNIKSANSILYVMASIYRKQLSLDECLLLNDKHAIIEGISSNIFAVKNGVLYTPPISDGCVDGVMRKKVIQIAEMNRIAVHEISIMQNVLLGADELFLTNAVHGIRWIVAYKQKRYFNKTSKKLIEKLNEFVSK